jgi:hypothetical protein
VGEVIFGLAGGGLLPRAVGWGLFGALIGATEGVAQRMPQKTLFGVYGGLLGGLIGGSTYESTAALLQLVGLGRGFAVALGGALGLVLLGLCVGLMVGLVEDLLRTSWLLFTSGRFEGQTRTLDPRKPATLVGRNELADICILADPAVASDHARLLWADGGCVLEALGGEVRVRSRSGGDFVPIQRHVLAPGDIFQIGSSRACYQTGGAVS